MADDNIIEVQVDVPVVEVAVVDLDGSPGPNGPAGTNGWSPVYGMASDGERRVLQLQNWTGGTGAVPTGIGRYLGETGLVVDIANGINVRGVIGLQGPQGNDGAPGAVLVGEGSNIFVEDRDPVYPDDGTTGDVWINGLSGEVFKREADAWSPQANIKGPKGDRGDPGPAGDQGVPGVSGTNGWSPSFVLVADGERLVLRLSGWLGGTGTPPTENVGSYLGNGTYTPTIAQALNVRGTTGLNGAPGAQGVNGLNFYRLAGVPPQSLGVVGETALNTLTFMLYQKNSGTPASWAELGIIKGADSTVPGPQGPAGAQGVVGPQGAASTVPGPAGPQGEPGVQGPAGAASTVPGPQGPQGDTGAQGPQGAASTVPGPQGPQGEPGATGAQGPQGATGAASTVPGPQGEVGATGAQGTQGVKGDTGAQGPQGVKGDTGAQGPAGTNGTNGTNGVDAIGAADLSGFAPGKPVTNQLFYRHRVVRAFSWPVGLTGSRGGSSIAATAAYALTIAKNGTAIGTINFAAGAALATFTLASAQNFVVTDIITITGQTTVDTTLADVDFNLRGSR